MVWAGISSQGTEYWVTFPEGQSANFLQLYISSEAGAAVTAQTTSGLIGTTTVAAGGAVTFPIPSYLQATLTDGIAAIGIHVTASAKISLYGFDYIPEASDGYLALPVEALGTSYMVTSFTNENYGGSDPVVGSEFAVVATQDCTHLTITPHTAIGSHPAGVPYGEILEQGQVYQLQDNIVGDDVTGTLITSDNPVAVIGGHDCAFVPVDNPSCNLLVEEFWPLQWWGIQFVTMPLYSRLNGDTFRFLASANGTSVTVNGYVYGPMNQGVYYQTTSSIPLYVTSNQPIFATQYSNGYNFDGVTNADPMMISIPPINEYASDYLVADESLSFTAGNFENLVAPTAAAASITVDGSTFPAADWTPIPGSGYSGIQITAPVGVHHSTGPVPFGVMAYGFAPYDAYGYPGGVSFTSNTPIPTNTPGAPCYTLTFTPTPTITPTSTPTYSQTPTVTRTQTATPSPTATATWTNTATPTATGTPTPTSTPSTTPTFSPTASTTFTPTSTSTFTPTCTPTPSPTTTYTFTPTPSPSWTLTPIWSLTPTPTFSTFTPTGTATPSFTSSKTPTPSPSFTVTPPFTFTFTPSSTDTPSWTPTPNWNTCPIEVWPDPFNPALAVGGVLKVSCLPPGATVDFYTVSGEMVRHIQESLGLALWNGQNRFGSPASSGIYFYVVLSNGYVLLEGKILLSRN